MSYESAPTTSSVFDFSIHNYYWSNLMITRTELLASVVCRMAATEGSPDYYNHMADLVENLHDRLRENGYGMSQAGMAFVEASDELRLIAKMQQSLINETRTE
jgi:hypothetical protein